MNLGLRRIYASLCLVVVLISLQLAPTTTANSSLSEVSEVSISWISVQPSLFITYQGNLIALVQVTILINSTDMIHPGLLLIGGSGPPEWTKSSDGWTMTQFAVEHLDNNGGWFPFDQYAGTIYVITNSSLPGLGFNNQLPAREGITPVGSNYYSYTSITESNATTTSVPGYQYNPSQLHTKYLLALSTTISHAPDFWVVVSAIDFGVIFGISALLLSMIWLIRVDYRKLKKSQISDFPGGLLTSLLVSTLVFIPVFWFSTRNFEAPLSYTWVDISLGVLMVAEILVAVTIVILKSASPSRSWLKRPAGAIKAVFWTRMNLWVLSLLALIGLFPFPYRVDPPWLWIAIQTIALSYYGPPYYGSIYYNLPLMILLFLASFLIITPTRRRRLTFGVLSALGAVASLVALPGIPTLYQYYGHALSITFYLPVAFAPYVPLLWVSITAIWIRRLFPELATFSSWLRSSLPRKPSADFVRLRWANLIAIVLSSFMLAALLQNGLIYDQLTIWFVLLVGMVLMYATLTLLVNPRKETETS